MKKILITGGRGFLGRNLAAHLAERKDCEIQVFEVEDSAEHLRRCLLEADVVFHLAGINRPKDVGEFETGNVGLTERICRIMREGGRTPNVVFSSSIQAELENAYGASKKKAEDALRKFGEDTGARVSIFRLNNLFGKWCRPNYNSVTATFCYNIANDLPIVVADPVREIDLSYVDDVVSAFVAEVEGVSERQIPSYRIKLGELAGRIQTFRDMRETLVAPDFADWFNRALYATYLSYVQPEARRQGLDIKSDARGSLAEFIKSKHFGQIFISRTNPGVTRGNHYHHTKTEKFFVVEGEGLIRMRAAQGGPLHEYAVSGKDYQVIDIPAGFTHCITNVGKGEMVTLFWSSEIFNPDRTDTYYLPVDVEQTQEAWVEQA